MDDPHGLRRFTEAQDGGGTYDRALAELRAGRKTSHWMWFVVPQIAGLGRSPASSSTGTPKRSAFSSFDPGEAPATT